MAAVAGILIPDVSNPIPATDASFDDEAAMQVTLHDRKLKHKSQQTLAIILHMGVEHARQILMLENSPAGPQPPGRPEPARLVERRQGCTGQLAHPIQ